MVDPDYLRARLQQIGGSRGTLLEHTANADGARYRMQHGLDAKDLPALVRSVLPENITIDRVENWTRRGEGSYQGDVHVEIPGTPGSANGGMRLNDTDGGGSELQVLAEVTVDVPLLGGTIESVVTGYVKDMLDAEAAFTQRWLAREP